MGTSLLCVDAIVDSDSACRSRLKDRMGAAYPEEQEPGKKRSTFLFYIGTVQARQETGSPRLSIASGGLPTPHLEMYLEDHSGKVSN